MGITRRDHPPPDRKECLPYKIVLTDIESESFAWALADRLQEKVSLGPIQNGFSYRIRLEAQEKTVRELEFWMDSIRERLVPLGITFQMEAIPADFYPWRQQPKSRYLRCNASRGHLPGRAEIWMISRGYVMNHRLTGPAQTIVTKDDVMTMWYVLDTMVEPFWYLLVPGVKIECVMEYLSRGPKHFQVVQSLYDNGIIDLDPTFVENLRIGLL